MTATKSRILLVMIIVMIQSVMMPALIVVPAEHIFAEVILEIAVDRMDMINIVLGIVILNQDLRTVNPVVMRFALFDTASPCEVNLLNL